MQVADRYEGYEGLCGRVGFSIPVNDPADEARRLTEMVRRIQSR